MDGYFVAPKSFNGNDHEEHRISMTYGGHVETCKGGNTFAVPGIYKILDIVYERYASLPLDKLLEYPIKISREGFKLTQPTKDYFIHSLKPMFMWHEYSKSTLNNVYEDLENGIVKLDKLSDTLNHMSIEGFNDFYIGDISKSIIQTLEIEGGHATADDFVNYQLIEESKFNYQYKNLNLTGHAGPSIGGLMVLKYLNGLTGESDDLEQALKNVYLERQNKYEFFGGRRNVIDNEISKISQSSSTIQVNTSDENLLRTVTWKRQMEYKIIDRKEVGKDREIYEPIINPISYTIRPVGIGSTVLYCDHIRPSFDGKNENDISLSFQNMVTLISQEETSVEINLTRLR